MTEHLDVLVVGAGLSGIGAGHYLQTECPWATYAIFEARDAIGGTWDLFRYPGIRSDSDMYTLGYSFRPWDGEKSIADGASILQYIKDTAAEAGIDEQIRFHHRIVRGRLVDRRTPAGTSPPSAPTPARPSSSPAGFLFSCSGYYRYDHGYQPDFAGMDRLRRARSSTRSLARGPRLRRQAGRGDRQRRHRRHADPVAGRRRPRTSRCCSARPPTSPSLPAKNPIANAAAQGAARPAGRPGHPLDQRPRHAGLLPAQPAPPELGEAGPAQGRRARSCPRATTSTPTSRPRYDPWDQRLCVVPDGDLFKAITAGTASVVTDHIDTLHRDRHPAAVGRGARGRHRRHRHRPRAAVHRRHRADGRRRDGRPRRAGSPTRG